MRNVVSYRTANLAHAPGAGPGVSAWTLTGIAFALGGAGLLGLLGAAVAFGISPVAGVPAGLAGLFLLAVAGGVLAATRRGRGYAVLAYVEQAVRLNLPLPGMLEAAERAETGRVRAGLRELRRRLEEGAPVAVALGRAVPSLPTRTVDLIASAERVGRLPQVLRRLTRPGRVQGAPAASPHGEAFLRWYPLLTMLALGIVFVMVLVFVMPKYEELFADFSIPLPPLTRAMTSAAEWVVFPLVALLGLVTLALLGRTVGDVFAPGWSGSNPFRGLTGRLAWHVPPFRGATRAAAMADACHVIADALESGRPLDWAVEEAARVRTNVVLERRLGRWAGRLRQGAPAADAAAAAGMPDLLVGVLRTAGGADAPEMLRFLARYYEGRFSRAAALLRGGLLPAAAILMGVPVGAFILGVFLPLIRLMDHLSDVIWR